MATLIESLRNLRSVLGSGGEHTKRVIDDAVRAIAERDNLAKEKADRLAAEARNPGATYWAGMAIEYQTQRDGMRKERDGMRKERDDARTTIARAAEQICTLQAERDEARACRRTASQSLRRDDLEERVARLERNVFGIPPRKP